jgi:small-conductance mechanosensitive channel
MTESKETILQFALQLALPLVILLIVLVLGFILRKFLFKRLSRLAQKTKSGLDDTIISAIKGPFIIWSLMLGVYIALQFSELPENTVHIAGKILLVLGLFSAILVLANISSGLTNLFSAGRARPLPGASLTQTVIRIIIFGVGFLVILNTLGISITPVLATLGVGGLAVALALQDTLSNLFAGFHIVLNRIVRVGDYIELDTGEKGYVTDINWRTTKVRMLPNNVVLIPNAKLTQTNITNYYLPAKDMAVLVNLGVHYNSDLQLVERITCEVAKEVMQEVTGGVPEFNPFIRYHTFGNSSIDFTVILRAREYVDQYIVKHEFIKRLHKRYAENGIVIPFPIMAVNYSQEKTE